MRAVESQSGETTVLEGGDAATEPARAGDEAEEGEPPSGLAGRRASSSASSTLSFASGESRPHRRSSSSSTLSFVATELAGFNNRGSSGISREELLEQGVPPAEADAILFQAHEDEVLQQQFVRWIWILCAATVLTIPVFLSLFIWLLVEFSMHHDTECTSPLLTYCIGAIVVFNVKVMNSLLIRCFCCWTDEHENEFGLPESPPARIRVYRMGLELFIFVWHCLGLAWAVVETADAEQGLPSCAGAAPMLLISITVYTTFNIAVTLFFVVNVIGLRRVLQIIYRNGLVSTPHAAPAGTLEKSTEPVDASTIEKHVQENPSCPICMEDYASGDAKDVLRVKGCGHIYHRQCLKSWMNVNSTCPLCRVDLAGPQPTAPRTPQAEPSARAGCPLAAAAQAPPTPAPGPAAIVMEARSDSMPAATGASGGSDP